MLPAPLLTFELYDDIIDALGSDSLLRQCLTNLPTANYYTIECLSALLLRISQKSALNKVHPFCTKFSLNPDALCNLVLHLGILTVGFLSAQSTTLIYFD